MIKTTKIVLLAVALLGTTHSALADRGIGKKAKNKVSLNISTNNSFKSSLYNNLKSGLTYKGSILVKKQISNNVMYNNTLVTFQKGNTVYILPYKHKIITPEIKQGYTGSKLQFRFINNFNLFIKKPLQMKWFFIYSKCYIY
ncbi:MAG: hypothetical protein IPP48_16270 [Chitinophagaceae bacterium]|nr:hypothetical protein [Chitinophagaceae bacterium]